MWHSGAMSWLAKLGWRERRMSCSSHIQGQRMHQLPLRRGMPWWKKMRELQILRMRQTSTWQTFRLDEKPILNVLLERLFCIPWCPRHPFRGNNSLNQTRPLLGHRVMISQIAFVAYSQVGAWARRLAQRCYPVSSYAYTWNEVTERHIHMLQKRDFYALKHVKIFV